MKNTLKIFATNAKKWFSDQGKSTLFLVFSVVVLNLGFGAHNIEKFAAVDEPLWLFGRIESYWQSLENHNLAGTLVSDKPGITVSIISGLGLLQADPHRYEAKNWEGRFYKPTQDIQNLYLAFRLPLFIFASLCLFLFYFFIERFAGRQTAVFSLIFIGLSPVLLGISRIINPDSLLWVFAPIAIFSFLAYQKQNHRAYLISSGVFFGLAILTKYVANILFIVFLAFIFLNYILNKNIHFSSWRDYLKKALKDYFILILIALFVFTLLCPATWVKPKVLLDATLLSQAFRSAWPVFAAFLGFVLLDLLAFKSALLSPVMDFMKRKSRFLVIAITGLFLGSILFTLINTFSGMKIFDFEKILLSPKSSYAFGSGSLGIFFADFYPLVFGVSVIALAAVIFAAAKILFKKTDGFENQTAFIMLAGFIPLYYLGSAMTNVASINRYQIMVFPIVFVLAGMGLNLLLKHFFQIKLLPAGLVLLLISVFSLLANPFYMSYASEILPAKYSVDLKNMGVGSYEAAEFLNSLPEAEKLNVWTDKSGMCYFFQGNCYSGFPKNKFENVKMDYAVVSAGRKTRTATMSRGKKDHPHYFAKYYDRSDDSIVFTLKINDRENQYVKIVKVDK